MTAEDILNHKQKGKEIISVTGDATIQEALQVMLYNRIGAVIVRQGDEIVGIWTERDLMKNTVTPGFDSRKTRIREVMNTELKWAPHTDDIYQLLDKFLGQRLRHLLVRKHDRFVGVLSTGDVVKADLMKKTRELEELNKMVSWDYYENWRWEEK